MEARWVGNRDGAWDAWDLWDECKHVAHIIEAQCLLENVLQFVFGFDLAP